VSSLRPLRVRRRPETVLSARLALAALAIGTLVGGFVALAGEPSLAPIVAWVVAATVALVAVWWILWPEDAAGTKRLAERESQVRTTDTAILLAAVASMGAVVLALVSTRNGQGLAATASVVVSVLATILSWALVNTVFALKSARLYDLDEDGGIEFGGEHPPAYSDFAYVAFTVGMSFTVAETEPVGTAMRKVTLAHALLSYLFGTLVLAVAVNLVTNLAQSG
jgi:uncharacterized membrane protein